jgi:predicted RNase H-like nuclease (RuvC/YqgF family)
VYESEGNRLEESWKELTARLEALKKFIIRLETLRVEIEASVPKGVDATKVYEAIDGLINRLNRWVEELVHKGL